MKDGTAQKISNAILSGAAGFASFVFSLSAFLFITEFNAQILAALTAGTFCLLISYIASERPNSESARAHAALGARLLAVEDGDLVSPAPEAVRRTLPKLAAAVDSLFAEVRASIERAQALALYDPVTALPNRLHFRSEADKVLGSGNGRQSAMMFVDLDRFKLVNDNLGHARGDQLLVMVANRLRAVISAECRDQAQRPLLARLAGDEFTMFLPHVASRAAVEDLACNIAQAISRPFKIGGHGVDIGASVGVALCPEHGTSVEALMRAADIAMYRAKARGGGRHFLFDEALAAEHREKNETEQALVEAIHRGEFRLAFQPQLSLATGEMAGAEALLRWDHPSEGVRMPGSFIPIAERTSVIAEIGDWVIGEVASVLADWQSSGRARRLAFNISPRQLERADFFARLRAAFASRNVPLSLVELEFTESAAMEVGPAVLGELAALRADGATIAIDDFGVGYSNIARLRSMPLDRVKLDPSLIADIEHCERARVVVQAVIQLIRGVGAEIVAEAVETMAQASILRAMGCEVVQGFIFAEPMSAEDYLDWVSKAELPMHRSVA